MNLNEQLVQFAQSHPDIQRLELFGSTVRGEAADDSDVDLLVTFTPEAEVTLLDLWGLKEELENSIQRSVDLMTRRAVEQSRNPFRRARILNEAVTIYGR